MPQLSRTRILFAVTTLLIAACGGSETELVADAAAGGGDQAVTTTTTTTTTTSTAPETTSSLPEITLRPRPPSDYAGFVAQTTACGAAAPLEATPMAFAAPGDQELNPEEMIKATITTSCGDITIELDPSIAPETVNSFVFLAQAGYFDGTVSHRILPSFVIQAGDPTATGSAGPGYTIPDELPAAGFIYEAGTLAMANAGPGTSGSQFFIVLEDAPLPPNYSVFGTVTAGWETIDRIVQIPLGESRFGEVSVPMETLYLERVAINQ